MTNSRFRFLNVGALLLVGASGLGLVGAGCHEPSGAQPSSVASVASALPVEPLASASGSAAAGAGSAPVPAASASASAAGAGAAGVGVGAESANAAQPGASAPSDSADAGPVLVDAEGKALAQTDERPTLSSPSFQQRIALVARAIQSGDAEPALSAFFPLVAYQQVKDVAKPERDYKLRLVANFKRDVLEYHRALGESAASAKFEGVTVSEKDAKWMAPGSEGNRVGYFRVLRSHLRFTLPTGRTRDFELTSLISWRGEWYVVHLHGFK